LEKGNRSAPETLELAAEHGLSVYDAAYLELAVRRTISRITRPKTRL